MKAEKHRSKIVSQLLNEVTEAERAFIHRRMVIAINIKRLLDKRGFSKSHFAELLDKHPSEITKWLSGTHNFTLETLCDIAVQFRVDITELLKDSPVLSIKTSKSLGSNPIVFEITQEFSDYSNFATKIIQNVRVTSEG